MVRHQWSHIMSQIWWKWTQRYVSGDQDSLLGIWPNMQQLGDRLPLLYDTSLKLTITDYIDNTCEAWAVYSFFNYPTV